jgi:transposase
MKEPLTMSDATGAAEALLGLPGFRVLEVEETPGEVIIRIETDAELVGCPRCGVVATAQDRMAVEYRDLAAFGRPARLVWRKRRWRCERLRARSGPGPRPRRPSRPGAC